jgi:hypothetical protein
MMILSADLETALALYTSEIGTDRDEAVRRILTDWLGARQYLGESAPSVDKDVKETVQYPEFMDDASGGAGG